MPSYPVYSGLEGIPLRGAAVGPASKIIQKGGLGMRSISAYWALLVGLLAVITQVVTYFSFLQVRWEARADDRRRFVWTVWAADLASDSVGTLQLAWVSAGQCLLASKS